MKKFDELLLQYFYGVGDTAQFLNRAVKYYDHFYTNAMIDSIYKADSIYTVSNQSRLIEQFKKGLTDEQKKNGSFFVKQTIQIAPGSQRIANELNNGAWQVYRFSNDISYLNKVLKWSRLSITAALSPENADTHAHTLYKLGKKKCHCMKKNSH
ncbi:hypothetical protein [Hydrotalea sp.]|uniref:hypothetical protein n=1 Tax=Hydrotalea sp. TaxID=2881279 RepID=UPI00262027F4|nr:hypothetical protein [Hydrotalea sp.]